MKSICADKIIMDKNSDLSQYWQEIIPDGATQQSKNKEMLHKLIDGVPVYVPHNRLLIISDCSTDTLEVDLNTKMTEVVS